MINQPAEKQGERIVFYVTPTAHPGSNSQRRGSGGLAQDSP